MKETWKQWLEQRGIEKWFQRDNLIILILSGVLLFIIALPTKESSAEKNKSGTESGVESGTESGAQSSSGLWGSIGIGNGTANDSGDKNAENSANTAQSTTNSWNGEQNGEDYCTYLERKLKETLSDMSGVGRVQVMITLKASEELVVEKDTPVNRSNTNEQDSQGGSRIANQVESAETTVYKTQGSDSVPYVIKTLLPEVEGVVVVAQGAGSGTVNESITEIVQALFDVEAHKVKVVKMETAN